MTKLWNTRTDSVVAVNLLDWFAECFTRLVGMDIRTEKDDFLFTPWRAVLQNRWFYGFPLSTASGC